MLKINNQIYNIVRVLNYLYKIKKSYSKYLNAVFHEIHKFDFATYSLYYWYSKEK